MSASDSIGVFVVDDHLPFLAAAEAVVDATPGFDLVGTAASAAEAMGRLDLDDGMIDLVLMDIDLGDGSGADVSAVVTEQHPHPVVFLISTMDAADVGTLPQECGASAFITKLELSPTELRRLWSKRHDGSNR